MANTSAFTYIKAFYFKLHISSLPLTVSLEETITFVASGIAFVIRSCLEIVDKLGITQHTICFLPFRNGCKNYSVF